MTEPPGIRISDSHWLLESRQFRFTVNQLSADTMLCDRRSLGFVTHDDGTVSVGIVTARVSASVEVTLTEAHELGTALLALQSPPQQEPAAGGDPT